MSRFWDPRLEFDRFAPVERPRVVAMWPYASNHGAREYAFAFHVSHSRGDQQWLRRHGRVRPPCLAGTS